MQINAKNDLRRDHRLERTGAPVLYLSSLAAFSNPGVDK